MMTLELDRMFQGRPIPGWLQRFESEPAGALEDLLLGRAALGSLNADEPTEVLLDWLESLGERSEFPDQVDAALARWIEQSWGRSSLPKARSAAVLALAWVRAANLIAFEPRLVQAARQLRTFFPEQRSFLSALSEGRARDPEGRAWLAVARHQKDRSLLTEWWRLCKLAPDVPWYHGIYGIQGLRGLPAETALREGTSPPEVAEGLARLASGLANRTEEGWLDAATAREEFQRTARLTMSAYPTFRWPSFWRHALHHRLKEEDGEARSWIQALFPQELKGIQESSGRVSQRRWAEPDPAWPPVIQRVLVGLRQGNLEVVGDARRLLHQQARFAEFTGDTHFVVRSACNFAARVRDSRPDLALEWAELARRFDPWNDFAWNTAAASLLALGRLPEARKVAVGAVRRFPQDAVARNTLAEVLKEQHRYSEAEAVYRETVSRFPEDVVARSGLAKALKDQHRYSEAEAVYRETVSRFPKDVVARNGLAEVLKDQHRYSEAEALYRETLSRFSQAEDARRGLEKLLRTRRKGDEEPAEEGAEPSESQTSHPEEILLQTGDLEVLLQDVYLLRSWVSRTDRSLLTSAPGTLRDLARERLAVLLASDRSSPELVGELGLLSIESQELEATLSLLREAARRYPGSARVRYTLARGEREAAARRRHLDEENPESPVLPWRRLGRLDERLLPLELLGEARTWLVQVDGSFLAEHARTSLGKLAYRIQTLKPATPNEEPSEDRSPDFVSWWTGEIRRHVFGGLPVTGANDITDLDSIRENLTRNAYLLNRLEEDWLTHWAPV